MRAMKDSGYSWLGNIPDRWVLERGKYLFMQRSHRGNTIELQLLSPTQKFGVIPQSMYEELTGMSAVKLNDKADLSLLKTIHKGDFCISLRSFQGGFEYSEYEGVVSPAYQVFYPLVPIADGYYKYLFKDTGFIEKMNSYTMTLRDGKNIAFSDFGDTYIPYPPVEEQQSIAAYLDRKGAEIDTLTADIATQIETLEQYKRSVITEAVTKGLNPDAEMKGSGYSWLGNIPDRWVLERGKYLFMQRSHRGNTIELQLLSPTQKFGVIPQSMYEELTGMSAVKLNDKADLSLLKTIHKGDFCISLRSFQGGFEYSEYEGVVSPAYQVFYPLVPIADGYYKYLFKDTGFIEKMNSYTMTLRDGKNIAFSDFGNTYIPYPPVEEQQSIANYLDCKCTEIDSILADKQKQLDTLAEYKKSLIYEYVTGKKEVPV
ncbi:MAG: restriction endonuclease subunit S [Lachnospiraceae bacterium]|nr:restriction endonuclease subunit S [Lachnospiraceae bacterium]